MSASIYDGSNRRDSITIPTFWLAIILSLLFHAAVMWKWLPHVRLPSLDDPERGQSAGSLTVQLAPPPSTPRVPSAPAVIERQPAAAKPPSPAKPPPRIERAPPVIALNKPAPAPAPPAPAPVQPAPTVAPAPKPAPPVGDLASYIEARRRERGASAASPDSAPSSPQGEDESARTNRIVAGNLASQKQLVFGYDPAHGGGVFEIRRIHDDNAEFLFFGWNKDIRRNTKQLIEVRKGNNSNIKIAVVRKMISIIRDYEPGDFLWESHRLGRSLTLSARAADNAGLEEFMMKEFFDDPRQPY